MKNEKEKKIISILTGKNIGTIIDIEINNTGNIDSLIIEQGRSLFNINKESVRLISFTKSKVVAT